MKRRRFIELGAASPILSFPIAFAAMGVRVYQGDHIDEPAREVVVAGEYDVVVSGAGPAGVCAVIGNQTATYSFAKMISAKSHFPESIYFGNVRS